MTRWLVALAGGVLFALVAYRGTPPARRILLGALRALAVTLAIALLLDAPAGAGRVPRPFVVLDASSSWRRGGDSAAWISAVARARASGADTIWLAGDSLRATPAPAAPADAATRIADATARARIAGRALVLITDGEADDAGALGALVAGSRIEVMPRAPFADAAVVSVDAPRRAVAGDTIDVSVTVRAGDAPVPDAALLLLADGRPIAHESLAALNARDERLAHLRVAVPVRTGPVLLSAVVRASGDREPRNDTATVVLEVARAAGAVFASTAPDEEMRFLVPVLRGALALPVRGYYRVAAGAWRREGTLAPSSEGEVRAALRDAPLAILHGDTALFGAPRALAPGALLLLPSATESDGEWYATAAPASPVEGALAGAPWDSLPPVAVADRAPEGEWSALTVARARRYEARSAIALGGAGRRIAVSGAHGFWRWRFAGGTSAEVYDELWGAILDWLMAERRDARAAVPDGALLRAGEPVRWRRGGGAADTTVHVLLAPRGGRADSLALHFAAGALTVETAPLAPGIYDARTAGGAAVLAVNASREWLPRAPTLAPLTVPGTAPARDAPPLRSEGWVYLLAIGALCAEWILRRSVGLR